MMTLWFAHGGKEAAPVIGSVLLNMAVFGAMLSYILRAISFIVLRRLNPDMPRPFLSPFGQYGAATVIAISAVTLFYQLQDPNFSKGVLWVIAWFATAGAYFALRGRQRLMLSPEEVFALATKPWSRVRAGELLSIGRLPRRCNGSGQLDLRARKFPLQIVSEPAPACARSRGSPF